MKEKSVAFCLLKLKALESLGDLQSAKVYLQPPLNSNRPSSDVDSGDENTAAGGYK